MPGACQSRAPACAAAQVESLHRHHVVADFVSFAAAFSFNKQTPPLIRSVAPPFHPANASLVCGMMFRAKSVLNTLHGKSLETGTFQGSFFVLVLFSGADTLHVTDVTARSFPFSPAFGTFGAAAEANGKDEEK